MAFSVSTLVDYVEEMKGALILQTIQGARTLKDCGVTIRPGIKNSEMINILDSNAEFQSDGGCSYNTSGTTTFTQRAITVSKIMVSETLCPEDLEVKYTQYAVQPGGTHDKLPFAEHIINQKLQYVNRNLENAIWQGETDHTWNTNFKQFDGWISVITAATDEVAGNTSGATSITATNILSLIEDMYSAAPARILNKPKVTLFMGNDNFRLLTIAMRRANLFHYDADNANFMMKFPGFPDNFNICACPGLNAANHAALPTSYQNRMFMTYPENLYFGTDLQNEYEKFDYWFSKDDQNIKSIIRFKAGCQVGITSDIVSYINA